MKNRTEIILEFNSLVIEQLEYLEKFEETDNQFYEKIADKLESKIAILKWVLQIENEKWIVK